MARISLAKRLLDILGLPGDIETIGKILQAWFGLSVVTGGWAWWYEGLHWAIFIASGVFAFGVIGFTKSFETYNKQRLENKLQITKIEPILMTYYKDEMTCDVGLLFKIRNSAEFEIFFDMPECQFVIGDRMAPESPQPRDIDLVQPKDSSDKITELIKKVSIKDLANGKFKATLTYGKQKDSLTMSMKCEFHVRTLVAHVGDRMILSGTYGLEKLEYERIR